MKISKEIEQHLVCPQTSKKLIRNEMFLQCASFPEIQYPIIEGIPILINETNSLFRINDFIQGSNTTFDLHENKWRKTIKKYMPKISNNIKTENNFRLLVKLLPADANILIVGGSIKGVGMALIYANKSFHMTETDVSFGPYTKIICDGHDLPFENETFDCVIVQAVLEHVLDPTRCVQQIFKVLKPNGIVYAETPFIQQVHMQQYDFSRFTHLGHRRLFRNFEEIISGPSSGPGMALAWSYTYFLRSFATSALMVNALTFFGYITSFYLKYFDYFLINRPGAYDAASAFYFMGRKSSQVLLDTALIKQYKGIHHKY